MGDVVVVQDDRPKIVTFRNGDVMIFASGMQGTPGVPQIYDQVAAPTPIAGYVLLWFQSGVSADPDDREMNLVVFP